MLSMASVAFFMGNIWNKMCIRDRLGVVAVARSGGLDALGSRVHPAFARVFTIVAYLAIGPCLAIPRTATTSFEMAVPPFVGADAPIGVYQLVYSCLLYTSGDYRQAGRQIPAARLRTISARVGVR